MFPAGFVQVNTFSRKAKGKPVGYVPQPNGCWEWTGALTKNPRHIKGIGSSGYGRLWWNGRPSTAHIYMYVQAKGPVPTGMELDHLCRNRKCVNPDHLEAVTRFVNFIRGESPNARNKRKTHCKNGHPLAGPDADLVPSQAKLGRRVCRICVNWPKSAGQGIATHDPQPE